MQRPLRVDSSRDRVSSSRENDKEAVACRVDLVAAVMVESIAQNAAMLAAQAAEVCARLPHELRRALNVGEKERHGAARKLGCGRVHRTIVAKRF
jgi:hypothetical protein